MTKSKKDDQKLKHVDEVSGGESMVSGRGGIGVDNVEVPHDQHSKAQRGYAEQQEDVSNQPDLSAAKHRKMTRSETIQKRLAARKAKLSKSNNTP